MTTSSCTHCPGSHTGTLPCLASATTKAAGGWLLVEHPGPWGAELAETPLPEPIAEAFEAARRFGIRPQLIRRSGRRRATPPIQVYVGRSLGPASAPWLEGREISSADEIRQLDLEIVATGRHAGFGQPVAGPLLLVCTHGRHNACCARTGGPLARRLSARYGSAVWETTHVGGDRFAANLVCLPYGLYYGNLDFPGAVAAVEASLRGEVVLDRYRGRAGLAEPAQAAEHFVRARTGVRGVHDIEVESTTVPPRRAAGSDGARGRVCRSVVRTPAGRYQVEVEQVPAAPCGTECQETLDTYILRDLSLLSAPTLV